VKKVLLKLDCRYHRGPEAWCRRFRHPLDRALEDNHRMDTRKKTPHLVQAEMQPQILDMDMEVDKQDEHLDRMKIEAVDPKYHGDHSHRDIGRI